MPKQLAYRLQFMSCMKKIIALFIVLFSLSACELLQNEQIPPAGDLIEGDGPNTISEENEPALGGRPAVLEEVYFDCDGSIGEFDIALKKYSRRMVLTVTPVALSGSGDIMLGFLNSSNGAYRVLDEGSIASVRRSKTYYVTSNDLQMYDRVYIRPNNGDAFTDITNVTEDARCTLATFPPAE